MKQFITLAISCLAWGGQLFFYPKATVDSPREKKETILTEEKPMIKEVRAQENEGIRPRNLTIAKIGLRKEVVEMGLNSNGLQGVPDNNQEVSWFTGGVKPGQRGSAVLAGHNAWRGEKGAFFELKKLAAGDKISLADTSGKEINFTVEAVKIYDTPDFPTQKIYGDNDRPRLNLVTCHGNYIEKTGTYDQRLVVMAVQD